MLIKHDKAECRAILFRGSLIDQEIEKYMRQSKIEPKVDEKSLAEAKRKITEMVKSIFQ